MAQHLSIDFSNLNRLGNLTTLVSSDCLQLREAVIFINGLWAMPLLVIIAVPTLTIGFGMYAESASHALPSMHGWTLCPVDTLLVFGDTHLFNG
jgi:hypothetical protein